MTQHLKKIAKLAAQGIQLKRLDGFNHEEKLLVVDLVTHGFLIPSSNGFVGRMTRKAMITDNEEEIKKVIISHVPGKSGQAVVQVM